MELLPAVSQRRVQDIAGCTWKMPTAVHKHGKIFVSLSRQHGEAMASLNGWGDQQLLDLGIVQTPLPSVSHIFFCCQGAEMAGCIPEEGSLTGSWVLQYLPLDCYCPLFTGITWCYTRYPVVFTGWKIQTDLPGLLKKNASFVVNFPSGMTCTDWILLHGLLSHVIVPLTLRQQHTTLN